MQRWLLPGLIGSVVLVGTLQVHGAPRPEGPRYLAFASNREGGVGKFDLYLYDLHARALVPLPGINCDLDDAHPTPNRNAQTIAFTSERHDAKPRKGGIFVYDRPAGTVREPAGINGPLAVGAGATTRSGELLALTWFSLPALPPGGALPTSVFLYNLKDSRFVTPDGLNPPGALHGLPALSGDGRWLAYSSGLIGQGVSLRLYDVKGRVPVDIAGVVPAGESAFASLNHTGRFLGFAAKPAGGETGWDVFVYDREKKALLPTPALTSPKDEQLTTLSADGRFVAFESNRAGGPTDIFVYDLREQQLVELPGLNSSARERHPSFSRE